MGGRGNDKQSPHPCFGWRQRSTGARTQPSSQSHTCLTLHSDCTQKKKKTLAGFLRPDDFMRHIPVFLEARLATSGIWESRSVLHSCRAANSQIAKDLHTTGNTHTRMHTHTRESYLRDGLQTAIQTVLHAAGNTATSLCAG